MNDTYLIDSAYIVQNVSYVAADLDNRWFTTCIIEAQITFLRPALGAKQYEELIAAVKDYQDNQVPMPPALEALWVVLRRPLVYFTLYLTIPVMNDRIENLGVGQNKDVYGFVDSPDPNRNALRNQHLVNANKFIVMVFELLDNNLNDYPLYRDHCKAGVQTYQTPGIGWPKLRSVYRVNRNPYPGRWWGKDCDNC